MSAIETIRAKLQKYPHLRYEHTPGSIIVEPESPDGFFVSFQEDDGSFTVGYDGWHEHFDSEAEALNCFAFGLSDECRLRVKSRGGSDYCWTVQHLVDGDWHDGSEVGLIFFAFWRPCRERFLQNRAIRDT
jgi:hypothetical protein